MFDAKNENNKKQNDYFLKCKSIHDYFTHLKDNSIKKNIIKIENNNIYIKYLEKPNIIFQDKGDDNN